jgi:hypothetical protein
MPRECPVGPVRSRCGVAGVAPVKLAEAAKYGMVTKATTLNGLKDERPAVRNAVTCAPIDRNCTSRSGYCFPSTVLALACRL